MDLSQVEEAMVARGKVDGQEGVGVRIAFHRIALKLTRPDVSARQAFENDYEFKITVIPEKSLKRVAVDVPSRQLASTD